MSEMEAAAVAASPREMAESTAPRSLGQDAWEDLRRNPIAIFSAVVILILLVMAAFPSLFTNRSPREDCQAGLSRQGPSGDAWFGYTVQGCDVFSRTIYGARASILVGTLAAIVIFLIGVTLGMVAGYFGARVDTAVSRVADVFFGIPFVLGAIIVLASVPSGDQRSFWIPVLKVVLALSILGWPSMMRLTRSATLQVRNADYVAAARALGASPRRILLKHVLPNAVQPAIVYATIALGGFIGAEATLSFLGVGLRAPVVSWGVDISDAQDFLRSDPHMLAFPAMFLSITVLAFIMLGDAVRDALDPKLR
ncbi:MAG: ABC transporter permease [Sporichthyaceae bacterium]